jgi:hypothetical protein
MEPRVRAGDWRDAMQLLFGDGVQTDGGLLGKRRVQQRPMTCKDGRQRHVAWISMSPGVTLPGWSECWIGVDLSELDRATVGTTK